uniref:Uncharacterized protein n=1 Tax=Chromera velia CCMP2878 TaxID=1169474 RepID=A0A0G4IC18_9ALVE|eukprot:Cvel_12889.t1-p1 / transcript=Cvel_12889.t1 / gene=Cvel_12889 / organism=Chromera_velia_CCMP2878 / gene_product=Probable NADH dehydrogenase, putative / transcript_product=Probable NADH dehydrogenase, putative / location=Cvel_scaffold861:19536-23615(+) / protein_length=551 / sequence_SO=supercontig / SO=protein_coding / is_pseudo=false
MKEKPSSTPVIGNSPPLTLSPEKNMFEKALEAAGGLTTQTLDVVEDAFMHYNRIFQTFRKGRDLREKSKDVPRIVVVGSGWAAHAFIKVIDALKYDVVVVSPRNYFVFTPMLTASSVGTVEYRSITEPIRKANPLVDYYEGEVVEVAPDQQKLCIKPTMGGGQYVEKFGGGKATKFCVPYDYLVFAPGVKAGTFGTPGVEKYCFFMKEIDDARRVRKAVSDIFERASMPDVSEEERKRLLKFVVVGAGPTGVEFTGEFNDLLVNEMKKYYPRLVDEVQVELLQSGNRILPVFHEELQNAAEETLIKAGVKVRKNSRVKEVMDGKIKLTSGEELPYGMCVWSAGTEAREITKMMIDKLGGKHKTAGKNKLIADQYLRALNSNGTIFTMGDASIVESGPLPQTAQVAAQQGAYIAHLFNREYDVRVPEGPTVPDAMDSPPSEEERKEDSGLPESARKPKKDFEKFLQWVWLRGKMTADPFDFLNLGMLAYLGQEQAVAQVEAKDLEVTRAQGKAGFFLWRSVYLVKQVSTRNRVLVLVDWLKSKLFGRDLTRL